MSVSNALVFDAKNAPRNVGKILEFGCRGNKTFFYVTGVVK